MARILYATKTAFAHLSRSPVVAGVTVGTISVVFLVLGIFALLGHNLSLVAERLGAGLQLTVYLEDEIADEQRAAVRAFLREAPESAQVDFVSRDAALTLFRERFGPQASVLDGLDDNPFPASFEVHFQPRARTPAAIGDLAQRVVNLPGVEEVQYGQAWMDKFFGFLETARALGLVIGALIILAALLIVSNTVRLTVYARRDELTILKLVGATDGFIKTPFYLEGLILGLTGAGLGTGFTWLTFHLLLPEVLVPLGLPGHRLSLVFLPPVGVMWMVLGGALLGMLGTLTSLWRHLKV